MANIELPKPNTNWQADYSYYLPRVDRIFLSNEKKFGVNKGTPSLDAIPPSRLDGTMDLYTVYIPAYTFNSSDVTIQYIENKRYTMRDIGKLEKRINNLEYYTNLSLLEKETEELVIKDAAGLDRFKNGRRWFDELKNRPAVRTGMDVGKESRSFGQKQSKESLKMMFQQDSESIKKVVKDKKKK